MVHRDGERLSRAVFPDTRHRGAVQRHLVADLGDGLTYREAFTTTAAQAVVDQLVNDRGLALERDAVPDPGRIVFIYRPGKEAISHQLSVVSQDAY